MWSTRLAPLALLIALLCWSHFAPDARSQTREAREVEAFTSVGFAISGTLYISEGETQAVEIEADEEILEYIETVVVDGRLRVRSTQETSWLSWLWGGNERTGTAEVYVTMPSLDGVSVAGSGDVIVQDTFTSDRLSVAIAGSGDIDMPLQASTVSARIAGSGSIRLRGTADRLSANIAGSGDVQAGDLQVERAEVQIAGSGDCYVNARERLSASIMGSGDVIYAGNPEIERGILGSGEVRAMD
ncbi:MAG: hypothetical protein GVY12_17210 [Bacteroidetes bacterium]|jgi:hypothetical protein|nr:hypothetical protein [Bacteroidota bacterium]